MARATLSFLLVGAATICGFFALASNWADNQALDTRGWIETSEELLADERIRDEVGTRIVEELPLENQEQAAVVVGEALGDPEIEALWEQANREAHAILLAVVEGGDSAAGLGEGGLVLDLTALRDTIAAGYGVDLGTAGTVTIPVFDADELETIEAADDVLSAVTVISLLLTLALYGLAIAIAPGRRSIVVAACGVSLLVIGAGTLFGRGISAAHAGDELGGTEGSRDAIEQAVLISTSSLGSMATLCVVLGSVAIAAVVVLRIVGRRDEAAARPR